MGDVEETRDHIKTVLKCIPYCLFFLFSMPFPPGSKELNHSSNYTREKSYFNIIGRQDSQVMHLWGKAGNFLS